jgi:formylglycine-generating enzyme required for sulfatase activity
MKLSDIAAVLTIIVAIIAIATFISGFWGLPEPSPTPTPSPSFTPSLSPTPTSAPTPSPTTPLFGVPVTAYPWQVTIDDAHKETQLIIPATETLYIPKSGYIYLVVDATFRNLDPAQQTNVSSEAVSVISEEGEKFVARGGGREGVISIGSPDDQGCTFTSWAAGDELQSSFIFILREDDIDQVFKLQFQEVPPIPFSVALPPPVTPTPTSTSTSTSTSTVDLGETFTNTIGMEFVLIPAGEFEMGSPSDEEMRRSEEGPVHHVNLENAFYMGRYEVTQKQWRAIMGDNPSHFKGDDLPVETVSWDDVQKFIVMLNEKEGTNKYRLPSEAEWEYACRAGTTTRYSFGDDKSKLGDYAWYIENSDGKTHPVGQKKPNSWGLYDMHGNVWEWVQDSWHDRYNGAPADGSAWEGDGANRVVRSGGRWMFASGCRSAFRYFNVPDTRFSLIGFRLLREQ